MILCAGISPAASGAWLPLATLAAKTCVAERPPGSVAVTEMKAFPLSTATTVTIEPSTETVATAVSPLSAVKVRVSPSGSEKWFAASSARVSPGAMSWCWSVSVISGPWLTVVTVAVVVCVADSPPGSVAVTVIVASPAPTATTVMMFAAMATVTTVVSEDSPA